MRKKLVVANWKMNKTRDEALQFILQYNAQDIALENTEAVVCAPYILLRCLVKRQGQSLKIGAQNMHYEQSGAYTGAISPALLQSTGVQYVIIGHSERRNLFGETNDTTALKLKAAYDNDLTPILCVGETAEQREAGKAREVVSEQLSIAIKGLDEKSIEQLIVAYEPNWAIGTGKPASKEDSNEAAVMIREIIKEKAGKGAATNVRILYGGSVDSKNIEEYISTSDIDGVLVGGASLKVSEFAEMVKIANK